VIGHPSGNLLSLTLGVRPAPPFFLRIHSTRSSAEVFVSFGVSRRYPNHSLIFGVSGFLSFSCKSGKIVKTSI